MRKTYPLKACEAEAKLCHGHPSQTTAQETNVFAFDLTEQAAA